MNDGGPAFPRSQTGEHGFIEDPGCEGMSLRDWFAGQALAGFCADLSRNGQFSDYAVDAYCMADAMLDERKEEP